MFIIIDSLGYVQGVHKTFEEASAEVFNQAKETGQKWDQSWEIKDKNKRSFWEYTIDVNQVYGLGGARVCRIYEIKEIENEW